MASPATLSGIASPARSLSRPERELARLKARSHAKRDKKKALKSYVPKPRMSKAEKHVKNAPLLLSSFKPEKMPIASTGYIGLRGKKSPATVYSLDELVGPTSRFGFKLFEWDGR